MKNNRLKIQLLLTGIITITSGMAQSKDILPAPNGIKQPIGLNNWRVIGTSYRTDNNTQRVILGNSIAIKAAKTGLTKPWPEGTILAKLVWKNTEHPQWNAAIVPNEFVHSEIMIKDSTKYKSTAGWGFARWKGLDQQPYGNEQSFEQECFSCHAHAKNSDHVFTIPAKTP